MSTQNHPVGLTAAALAEQFKLVRFQLFNWGTFSNLFNVGIAKRGFLFVGPSGAGKSTILDAHATLTTPPKWVGFNLAAREGEAGQNGDRNLMTYIRGAWSQQTGKSGEAVQQYLRENTTWSALSETYQSGTRTVTIVQVFWVRGKTTDRKDIKRTYLVADRAFDIQELQPFADKDFDLKLVRALPGVFVHDEFSGYGERLRRYMGIESEGAMRLLHKTQSAKNLGDINEFLRDFTLEPPQTFELAKRVVELFQSLREAHATVVDTRRQIEVLAPARDAYDKLLGHRAQLAKLAAHRADLAAYKEQLKAKLYKSLIGALTAEVEQNAEKAQYWRGLEAEAKDALNLLLGKRNGNAAAQIAQCEAELMVAQTALRAVEGAQPLVTGAAVLLGGAVPTTDAEWQAMLAQARVHLEDFERTQQEQQARRDDLRMDQRETRQQLSRVQAELAVLVRQRSNMPSNLLDVRVRICEELCLEDNALPFAGELVDVTADEHQWKGAAERLMRSFAEHLLVREADFKLVSSYVNTNHLGALVKLYRAEPATGVVAKPGSLASKLTYSDHPLAGWVAQKACQLFDHACVENLADMAGHRRAVTRQGLGKSDEFSFRKDDRYRVDDRSRWILGGDTRVKVASLRGEADALDQKVKALDADIQALAPTKSMLENIKGLERCMEFDWAALDLASAQRKHAAAQAKLNVAKEVTPELAQLEVQIAEQEQVHADAQRQASRLEAQNSTLENSIEAYGARQEKLDAALVELQLPDAVAVDLQARFAAQAAVVELDNIELVAGQVSDAFNREERSIQTQSTNCLHELTTQFREYIRGWPAKAAGLDAVEASAPEFLEVLREMEADGLPKHEERFQSELQRIGTSELMSMNARLETERKDIRSRMDAVNASLKTTAFNKGTYLVIEPREKSIPAVMAFRQSLKEACGNYLQDQTPAELERRFTVLNEIVKLLESPDAQAKTWRELCLDVRRHVEFVIREFNDAGDELEVYRSGAGKSGGQRQKLTATILAAALRYQLGGQDTGVPKFSTVFMDEAFDKADAEFTDLAMKVFETFGFQLVVATPLKSVMTLEPYIGGACFVHIEQRKHSRIVPVTYLDGEKNLDFKNAGVSVEADDDI